MRSVSQWPVLYHHVGNGSSGEGDQLEGRSSNADVLADVNSPVIDLSDVVWWCCCESEFHFSVWDDATWLSSCLEIKEQVGCWSNAMVQRGEYITWRKCSAEDALWVHDLLVESRTWAEALIIKTHCYGRYSDKWEGTSKVPKAMAEVLEWKISRQTLWRSNTVTKCVPFDSIECFITVGEIADGHW